MAKNKDKVISNLSKDELVSKVRELDESLFRARMKKTTGQLEDTASIWRMRKDLSRAKTFLTQIEKGARK